MVKPMNRRRRSRDQEDVRQQPAAKPKLVPTRLRIIAGQMGGRKIEYNGDPTTRPMKERTREALFSLLGGYLYNTFAIDLFGGTGILAFESISRGAEQAIILELSRPAVSTIQQNSQHLNLTERIEVFHVDTLRWLRNIGMSFSSWPDLPWVVFCCPPYQMWKSDTERLCGGLADMFEMSPVGSRFVCETEFDFDLPAALPKLEWAIRNYPPANIAICEKH